MEMFTFLASGGLTGPADINTGLKFVIKDSVGPYLSTPDALRRQVGQGADRATLRPDQGLSRMRQRALDLFVRWQEASILLVALLLIA